MENQGEFVLGRCVEVQYLNLKKVGSECDEWDQVRLLGHLGDVVNDYVQNVMWQGPWSESVVLGRFYHVFVVVND